MIIVLKNFSSFSYDNEPFIKNSFAYFLVVGTEIKIAIKILKNNPFTKFN